jgi:hypothetical protein
MLQETTNLRATTTDLIVVNTVAGTVKISILWWQTFNNGSMPTVRRRWLLYVGTILDGITAVSRTPAVMRITTPGLKAFKYSTWKSMSVFDKLKGNDGTC